MKKSLAVSTTTVILALVLVSLDSASGQARAAAPVGFVLEVEGNWLLESESQALSTVKVGQALSADGRLIAASEPVQARIVVAYADGRRAVYTRPGTYTEPIDLRLKAPKSVSGFERLLAACARLLHGQPEQYAATLARGESRVQLQEAVLAASSDGVDLALLFTATVDVGCALRLEQLVSTTDLQWELRGQTPADSACPPVVDLGPGLYRATWLQADEEAYSRVLRPTLVAAWFVVAPEAQQPDLLERFEWLQAQLAKVEDEAISRSWLRASLRQLWQEAGAQR